MHSTLCNQSGTICTNVQSSARNRSVALSTMRSRSLCPLVWSLLSTVLPRFLSERWSRKRGQFRRNGPRRTTKPRATPSRRKKLLQRKQRKLEHKLRRHNPTQPHLHHQGHLPLAPAQDRSAMVSRKSRLTATRQGRLLINPQHLPLNSPTLSRPKLRHFHARGENFDLRRTRTGVSFYPHTCGKRCDARNAMGKVVEPASPVSAWTISASRARLLGIPAPSAGDGSSADVMTICFSCIGASGCLSSLAPVGSSSGHHVMFWWEFFMHVVQEFSGLGRPM